MLLRTYDRLRKGYIDVVSYHDIVRIIYDSWISYDNVYDWTKLMRSLAHGIRSVYIHFLPFLDLVRDSVEDELMVMVNVFERDKDRLIEVRWDEA